MLKDGGARGTNFFSDSLTHCIGGSNHYKHDVCDARDIYEIPAVHENWVILSSMCQKLLPTKAFSIAEPRLLANTSICLTNVSKHDCKVLWALVTFHGGRCTLALNKRTTHLIATGMKGGKYDYVSRNMPHVKVVTPDWLTDCVFHRKRCDESSYHPGLLIQKQTNGEIHEFQATNSHSKEYERKKSSKKTYKHSRPRVLFSGFNNLIAERRMVVELGGKMAKSNRRASHLVMKTPKRTLKFLCCVSTCKYIVSYEWLRDSHNCDTFLDETKYAIKEISVEGVKCDVPSVLGMPNRDRLFRGKTFYATPNVRPAASDMREIIKCAGGALEFEARSLECAKEAGENSYFIITCSEDMHLVLHLVKHGIGVCSTEFVLSAVMTQELDLNKVFHKPSVPR